MRDVTIVDEMTKEESSSMFARFQYRFSLWNPWRRVFFVLLIFLLFNCIPMLLVWLFPPPIIVANPDSFTPTLMLAGNWPIAIPMVLVVVGILGTNLVFRISEDTNFLLRIISLIVCIEIVLLVSAVAFSAQSFWYWVYYPILDPGSPFPGISFSELTLDLWFTLAVDAFLLTHLALGVLLFFTGIATLLFTLICESMI